MTNYKKLIARGRSTVRVGIALLGICGAAIATAQTPGAPTIDSTTQESSTSVLLKYTLVDSPTSVQVRATNTSSNATNTISLSGNSLTSACDGGSTCETTFTGLTAGQSYQFDARGRVNQGTWGAWATKSTAVSTHPNFSLPNDLMVGSDNAERVALLAELSGDGDSEDSATSALFTFTNDRMFVSGVHAWTYSGSVSPTNSVRVYVRTDSDNLFTDDYVELEGTYSGTRTEISANVEITATLKSDTDVQIKRTIALNVVRNRAPVFGITSATFRLEENEAHTIDVASDFLLTDADGNDLTYRMNVVAPSGDTTWTLDSTTGMLTLSEGRSLDYERTRRYTLDINAVDTSGARSNTLRITINVTDVNDAPTSIVEPTDTKMHRNMLAHHNFLTLPVNRIFTDPEGDRLCFSATQTRGTDWATIDLNVGPTTCRYGSIRVTRQQMIGHQGVEEIEISVTATEEDGGGSATATVTASIIYGLNLPPVIWGGRLPNAADDTPYWSEVTISENQPFVMVFTAQDVQPPRDRLCFSLSGPDARHFKLVNSVLAGKSVECGYYGSNSEPGSLPNSFQINVESREALDYEAIDGGYEFNLVATDLYGAQAVLPLLIEPEDRIEPPSSEPIPAAFFLVGDDPKDYWLDDYFTSESDSAQPLEYEAYAANRSLVTVRLSGGVLTITPTSTSLSPSKRETRVHVTATDNNGLSTSRSIDVSIKNSNTDPTYSVSSISYTVAENTQAGRHIGSRIRASDADGDTITYSIPDTDDAIAIDANSGQLEVGKAGLNFEERDSYEFTVYAHDGYGGYDYLDVAVSVRDVNEAPMPKSDRIPDVETIAGVTKADVFNANDYFTDPDIDDTSLRFDTASNSSAIASATVDDDGFVSVRGKRRGSATITITAYDRGNLKARKTFKATVSDNARPVVARTISTVEVQVRGTEEVDLEPLFTDDATDRLRYTVVYEDHDIATASIDGSVMIIRGRGAGSTEMTVTAHDLANNEASITFDVEVEANRAPRVVNEVDDITVRIGQTRPRIDISDVFEDPGDTFTLIAYTADANIATAYILNDGRTMRISPYGEGETTGTLRARDSNEGFTEHEFNITVLERNDPPTVRKTIADVELDTDTSRHDVSLWRVFDDEDTDSLVYSVAASTDRYADVILRQNPYKVRILPIKAGTTTVTVTVEDDIGQTANVSFDVIIVEPDNNNAPTVAMAIDDQTLNSGSRYSVNLNDVFDDADGDVLSFAATSANEAVATTQLLRSGSLRVFAEGVGSTTISVTATDANDASATDTFTVTVKTSPSATGHVANVTLQLGGETKSIDLLNAFVDADGDTLTYSAVSSNAEVVSVDQMQSLIQLTPMTKGGATVIAKATDPSGQFAVQSFRVMVSDSKLNQVASDALAGYGRSILSTVSTAIGNRVASAQANDRENARWVRRTGTGDGVTASARANSISARTLLPPTTASIKDMPGIGDTWYDDRRVFDEFGDSMNFTNLLSGFNTSGPFQFWSSGDSQSFANDGFHGSSDSRIVGVDVKKKNLLLGLSLKQSVGEMSYEWGTVNRTQHAELLSAIPYVSFSPTPQTTYWASLGLGNGSLSTLERNTELGSDELHMHIGLLGARRDLAVSDKYKLALRADAGHVKLFTSNGGDTSDRLDSAVNQIRVGAVGSFTKHFAGFSITPSGEIALRRNGGNGDTGLGLDAVGGLSFKSGVFSIEARGRTVAVHSNESIRESGYSLTASVQSRRDGRGLSMSIAPSIGMRTDPTSLWSGQVHGLDLANAAQSLENAKAMNTRLEYGLLVDRARYSLKPYVNVYNDEFGQTAIGVGGSLNQLFKARTNLGLNVQFIQRESSSKAKDSTIALTGLVRF